MIYLKKSCKKLVESVTDIERMILKIVILPDIIVLSHN